MPKPPKVEKPTPLPNAPSAASYITKPTSANYAAANRPNKLMAEAFGRLPSTTGMKSLIGAA